MLLGALLFGYQVWQRGTFTLLSTIGLLLFLFGIIVSVIKIRCPFCNHFLGIWGPVGEFCSFCGGNFKDEL